MQRSFEADDLLSAQGVLPPEEVDARTTSNPQENLTSLLWVAGDPLCLWPHYIWLGRIQASLEDVWWLPFGPGSTAARAGSFAA